MIQFDASEYSEESRRVLHKVVEEIREQFFVGGRRTQFWFYPTQVTDTSLTEPIIQKWLTVLSSKGLLYFYRPATGFDFEQALAVSQGRMSDGYNWQPHMMMPFISGFPTDSFPGFAVDILATNLDELLNAVSRKMIFAGIHKDKLGQFYYDGTPLVQINNSPLRRALLDGLLTADKHTLSREELLHIMASFDSDDSDNNAKLTQNVYLINKEIFSTSNHKVSLLSHLSGRTADYYFLQINN